MSEATNYSRPRSATIFQFPQLARGQATVKPVAMAPTAELYATTFPTRHGLLMLFESWLFAAERDGVCLRQPQYAEALKRAISALNASDSVPEAIAILRLQETTLARLSSPKFDRDE
jgi:hypothetical protein